MTHDQSVALAALVVLHPLAACSDDASATPWLGFEDRSERADVSSSPYPQATLPNCIFDDLRSERPGDFCIPEHFLGALAVADYDDDGWPDVFVSRRGGPDRLLRNRGDGSFEDVAERAGLSSTGLTGAAAWFDAEGDGDLDLFVSVVNGYQHHLFINAGDGTFGDQAVERGAAVQTSDLHVGMGIAVGDYDLDGYLDLFVTEWSYEAAMGPKLDHNRLLHNRGAQAPGTFEDVTEQVGIDLRGDDPRFEDFPGVYGFAPAFVDLDGDRWPELAIAADFGTSRLYANDRDGGFTDVTEAAGVGLEDNGMGSTFGDFDGDGDLDWFVTSISHRGEDQGDNRLYRNDGDLEFVDIAFDQGLDASGWGWGATLFDADHDGDLDLAATGGWNSLLFLHDPLVVWTQDEEGWTQRQEELGVDFRQQGRGLVAFDHDRDGDLDLMVGSNLDSPALYDNDVDGGAWLGVRLRGLAPNTQAIGAVVRVRPHDEAPAQVRHIGVGSHFLGQAEAIAHFGLGHARTVEIEVVWPTTGKRQRLSSVETNQYLEISETP